MIDKILILSYHETMKKILVIFYIIQSTIAFSQEIYTPGCIYENYQPIPVYWINDKIEILGKPMGTFGEATSILNYNGRLLVFGYLVYENDYRKIPVFWTDKLTFNILYFPEYYYSDCFIKRAYLLDETVYILGYLQDIYGHYSTIIWKNFNNYIIVKENYRDTFILDMEINNDTIIIAGYVQDYNGILREIYESNISTEYFRLENKSNEIFCYDFDNCIINFVKIIDDDIYYCATVNNKYIVIKNNETLYKDESYQESIIYDIMKINNKLFILAYVKDSVGIKLLYGDGENPNVEICSGRIIHTAEVVGIKENKPIVIFSEYEKHHFFEHYEEIFEHYEEKQYGIIINDNIVELKH
jgi:hypothetical protein